MVARTDVVRETLKRHIPHTENSAIGILLQPEVWALIVGAIGIVGSILQFSKSPSVRKMGKRIVTAVEYVKDAEGNLIPAERVPPVVKVSKQQLLVQIQAAQHQLDMLGIDADPARRARLQTTIDTLLEVLAKDMRGVDA